MRVLAIIPARGGSKGVPGKNLRAIAGKPLIGWSIEQARQAALVTDVVVSTDDPAIAEAARQLGAQVPGLRPAALATDQAPTEPAMLHALEAMERHADPYDAVVLLQPTSPLRLTGTVDRAITQLLEESLDSLLGVVESHAFYWRAGPPVTAAYDYTRRPRRQDIAREHRAFRETGSIYVTRRQTLVEAQNRLGGRIGLFHMAQEEGLELDSLLDFTIVETMMKDLGL